MAVELDRATGEYFEDLAQSPKSSMPFTWAGWCITNTTGTSVNTLQWQGTDATANNRWNLYQNNSTLRIEWRRTTTQNANTSNSFTAGVWAHVCGIFTSTSDMRAILDGDWANSGQETTGGTAPTNSVDSRLWADRNGGNSFNGDVACWTAWEVALTQEEVEALAAGAYPSMIRPQSILYHLPLATVDTGYNVPTWNERGMTWAIQGTPVKLEDYPPVTMRSPPFVGGIAGAPAGNAMPMAQDNYFRRRMG